MAQALMQSRPRMKKARLVLLSRAKGVKFNALTIDVTQKKHHANLKSQQPAVEYDEAVAAAASGIIGR